MNELVCRSLVRERAISYDESLWALTTYLPCEICGVWTTMFDMHHRQFRSRGGVWRPSNVILLCRVRCHDLATDEDHPVPGVNVHSWADPAEVPVKLWYTDSPVCLDDEGGYGPCCGVE